MATFATTKEKLVNAWNGVNAPAAPAGGTMPASGTPTGSPATPATPSWLAGANALRASGQMASMGGYTDPATGLQYSPVMKVVTPGNEQQDPVYEQVGWRETRGNVGDAFTGYDLQGNSGFDATLGGLYSSTVADTSDTWLDKLIKGGILAGTGMGLGQLAGIGGQVAGAGDAFMPGALDSATGAVLGDATMPGALASFGANPATTSLGALAVGTGDAFLPGALNAAAGTVLGDAYLPGALGSFGANPALTGTTGPLVLGGLGGGTAALSSGTAGVSGAGAAGTGTGSAAGTAGTAATTAATGLGAATPAVTAAGTGLTLDSIGKWISDNKNTLGLGAAAIGALGAGSGGGTSPTPKTPEQVAADQLAINKGIIDQTAPLLHPNSVNPTGSSTWTRGPDGQWTNTQTLNAGSQGLFDSSTQGLQGLLSGLNPNEKAPELIKDAGGKYNQQLADAIYARMERQFKPAQEAARAKLETRLAERGFAPGTDGWDKEMNRFDQQIGGQIQDATNQAQITAATQGLNEANFTNNALLGEFNATGNNRATLAQLLSGARNGSIAGLNTLPTSGSSPALPATSAAGVNATNYGAELDKYNNDSQRQNDLWATLMKYGLNLFGK